MTQPQPGDFICVPIEGGVGAAIALGEKLMGDGFVGVQHAAIYIGHGIIIEAMPGGATRGSITEYDADTILWSSGHFELTVTQRSQIMANALQFVGVPYSFLDYLGLALFRFGLRPAWLKRYIASTGHMICSQLVDQCYQNAGVQLFADGRISGDVTPADLADLIFEQEKNDGHPAAVDGTRG